MRTLLEAGPGGLLSSHVSPAVVQLLFFCLEFCRHSFIHGKICFVITEFAVLEALLDGDFFFCDEVLFEFGEDAGKGGACCCSPMLAAWLLPWPLLVRMQLPFTSVLLCVEGLIVEVCIGQTGLWKSFSMLEVE